MRFDCVTEDYFGNSKQAPNNKSRSLKTSKKLLLEACRMSSDGEYEYDYSDEEDYVLEDDDDHMDWTAGATTDNPNAAPTGK